MKRVVAAAALVGVLAVPGLARAGSSTDAALALGAFAVFNQMLSGTGVFGVGRQAVLAAPPPAVYAPAPPVAYAPPPPPVVYAPAPPPPVVYAPAPPPVVYAPAARPVVVYQTPPRVVYRAPAVVYKPVPVYRSSVRHEHWKHRGR
jgi:hypothetical protein